jgi:hypothetical protein
LRAALDGEAADRERARLKRAYEEDADAKERAAELRTAQQEPTPGLSLDAHEEAQASVRTVQGEPRSPASDARPVTKPMLPKPAAMPQFAGSSVPDEEAERPAAPAPRRVRLLLIGALVMLALLTVAIVVAAQRTGADVASGSSLTATPSTAGTGSERPGAVTAAPATSTTAAVETPLTPTANARPSGTVEPSRTATPRSTSDSPAKSTSSSPDWF